MKATQRAPAVDSILVVPIEFLLLVFASWTLSYHLWLLLELPARFVFAPALALVFIGALALRRAWSNDLRRSRAQRGTRAGGRGPLLVLIAMGGVCTAFSLLVSLHNYDDLAFFQRALVQLGSLDAPFLLGDTAHNRPGLPALSVTHLMSSYEVLVAMGAAFLHLDPLGAYHNGAPAVTLFLLPVVYVLLYSSFGLGPWMSLVSTAAAIGFLVLDGEPAQSFGRFGPVRAQQGKVVLVMLLLPTLLFLSMRALRAPLPRNLFFVAAATVCGPGLTGSGVFMVPILVFGVAATFFVSTRITAERLRSCVLVCVAAGYAVALALAFATGLLPGPADIEVWNIWGSTIWWENLGLIVGGRWALARDLLLLLAIPWVALAPPLRRFPALLTLVLCAVFANPLTGPFWLEHLHSTAYWRLAFLFPLPFCAGLIVPALSSLRPSRTSLVAAGLTAAVAATSVMAYQGSTMKRAHLKPPFDYRFEPRVHEFARRVAPDLDGRNVLAPYGVVMALGLLNPTVRFEITRPFETRHIFNNAGDPAEGLRREAAQRRVQTPFGIARMDEALQEAIAQGVDTLVVVRDALPEVSALMRLPDEEWEIRRYDEYVLILRNGK